MSSPTRSRTVLAGVIGNVLEWYDFALFGFLAPVIAPLFFPSEDRLASLLNTYGVFALGFLMRPLGGILFGHLGDRMGRKHALQWSVLLMALPTTCIAFLPTYHHVGFVAPLLLTIIRMLQGVSVGGEFIGSMSFLGEHADAHRRGFIGSWCTFSGGLGNLLGSGVAALVTTLIPHEHLHSWGWRLPFLAGIAVGFVGMWLRRDVAESPTFTRASEAGEQVRIPLLLALRRDYLAIFQTMGLALMLSIGFYLPWVWLPTWLSAINKPHVRESTALIVNTVAMSVMTALIPVAGAMSDRVGRRRLLLAGCLAVLFICYPLFVVLASGNPWLDLQGQLVFAVFLALVYGPSAAALVELFPTQTRYSGIAFAYNVTLAVVGGTTPLVATWLIDETGYAKAPAFYLMAAALLAAVAVAWMPDRTGEELR